MVFPLEQGPALGRCGQLLSYQISTGSHHQNWFHFLCIGTQPGPLTTSHRQGGRNTPVTPGRIPSSPHTETWKLNLRSSLTFQAPQV